MGRLARILLLAAGVLLSGPLLWGEDTWKDVNRIVAIGDVHGDYDQFASMLRAGGIIDADAKWTGGKTHLVQTGDVVDRGADSRKALELLMSLEKQAKSAGGYVHALIGNHEAMNMYGDLRYVSPGEFAAFADANSERIRGMYWTQHAREIGKEKANDSYKKQWESKYPLGYFEHRTAFAPDGRYGKWIRGHNTVVRINDMVFLHAGIGPKYAKQKIGQINAEISRELEDFSKLEGGMAMDPEGPLWYRGLAQDSEAALEDHLKAVLERWGAGQMIIGHTVSKGFVTPRFHGRVLMIDVGLSKAYGSRPSFLIVEDGKEFAMHRGTKVPIVAASPVELARYLNQIMNIDSAAR